MPTEEQIQIIAEREAQNVSDNGSPGALAHNTKTIATAIRESLPIALMHAVSICNSKKCGGKSQSYLVACDEIEISLLASIERLQDGEPMEAMAVVC